MAKFLKVTACLLAVAAPLALAMPVSAQTAAEAQDAAALSGVTPAGATFTLSPGWTRKEAPSLVELAAPEGDFRIAIVEVGAAADASAAAAKAWQLWSPSQTRPPKIVTARPPRNGWEERQVIDYETSPNEKRALYAVAFRKGADWTLVLIDGAEATADKRAAAIGLVQQSLRPAGYARESFAGRQAHPMDAARIAELRSFVEQSIKELGVPGAGIAITDRNGTLYAGGVGVRAMGKPEPVDGDTIFAIASNTKGMATLLLAKLVDEGKLRWDEPVTEAYAPFRLGSDATTAKVLVRHLVCACTGLPRKDFQVILNSDPNAAAKDTFAQLAVTEPTSGFGEVFQYNNLMASAAGYIGGHLAEPEVADLDKAFDTAIHRLVWGPLGMTRTTLDFGKATQGNWAWPHATDITGAHQPILDAGQKLNFAFTRYGAAGGAWSTAADLAKYVRFELNVGRLDDGTQYVSAANVLQRRVANVPVGEDRVYGMGMQVDRDYGVDVVHHGGSLAGYKSDIIIIPEAGIGAVLLTNSDYGQALLRPFMRRLLELLYDGKPEAASDVSAAAARYNAEIAAEAALVSVTPDPAAVAGLAASYYNADLGPLKVTRDAKETRFAFRTMSTPVGTRKNEDGTLSFVGLDPTLLFFPLVAGTQDGKRTLVVRDSQHEFVFVEQ
ncbi:serine hydrolase domain-containing protein [Erythrobacter colymbi]|uniref:serine hydrolase domain-containing protein n=1 Tax=Erythrobacter colymbi TaxID=1161202 RepID=UPI001980795E|nr:serine hydrolase domain-containing protein [Erythrobacter colymbi]